MRQPAAAASNRQAKGGGGCGGGNQRRQAMRRPSSTCLPLRTSVPQELEAARSEAAQLREQVAALQAGPQQQAAELEAARREAEQLRERVEDLQRQLRQAHASKAPSHAELARGPALAPRGSQQPDMELSPPREGPQAARAVARLQFAAAAPETRNSQPRSPSAQLRGAGSPTSPAGRVCCSSGDKATPTARRACSWLQAASSSPARPAAASFTACQLPGGEEPQCWYLWAPAAHSPTCCPRCAATT